MADKTTTLKTNTNDNVYPNVIGDNRKNAFVDSSTITHHFYDQTHKVGFQIANETNIKIQNSLQKPKGLIKTELVGVGTNGQENIEIGDNLTLANGKLSASGGGGGSVYLEATYDFERNTGSYTGTISNNTIGIHISDIGYLPFSYISDGVGIVYFFSEVSSHLNIDIFSCYDNVINGDTKVFQGRIWSHFITMTNSNDNISLYLTIHNNDSSEYTANTLYSYFTGNNNKALANGNLHGVVPTYISGERGKISIYYRTPGDSNINPTPDEYQDLSSFTITDDVSPVE